MSEPPLVRDILPSFAQELRTLAAREAPELTAQLSGLRLVGRCRCGQTDCATFHVLTERLAPPARGHGPSEHVCIDLEPDVGLVVVDVERGRLTSVEVLNRPDVKTLLDAVLPPHSGARLP